MNTYDFCSMLLLSFSVTPGCVMKPGKSQRRWGVILGEEPSYLHCFFYGFVPSLWLLI